MKYIIKESRFKEFISNYLDSFVINHGASIHGNFIIIEGSSNTDDEFYPPILMEFDYEDGRLYISKDVLEDLHSLFGLNSEMSHEYIKEWFQNHFDVNVLYTQT